MKVRNTLLLIALLSAPIVHADIITQWNDAALNAIRVSATPPPVASRALAMTHLAVYDAVNSITLSHDAYLGYQSVTGPTSMEAAAAQAAHTVLANLYPTQKPIFDALLNTQLATVSDLTQRTNGITLGINAGTQMLTSRVGDGSASVATYINPPPGTIGVWTPTPAAFAPAALPQWGYVAPFAMTSGSQFRPAGPPSINSGYYTASYNEVKSLGSKTSSTRTVDQTNMAYFWADGGGTATPPGHWNLIAQQISGDKSLGLEQNARLFALLNMATADAAIAAWDSKYDADYWRPITAIRTDDGNNDTLVDAGWTPLLNTPNFPAYVSGHSTFSGAAGGILSEYFGTDLISFTVVNEDSTALPGGYTRSFDSISSAVDEAGQSRIYGGIHFQFDNVDGKVAGAQISDFVFANYLGAVPEPSTAFLALLSGSLLMMRRRR